MSVAQVLARFREVDGRDSMSRASIWQGNAGTLFGNNVVYSDPGLATATVTSQVKTTAVTTFTVGGTIFSKGITDNFWTLAGTTVAINSWQKYALCVDDTGVATVVEATQSTVSAAAIRWANVTPLAGTFTKNPWAALAAILNASRCIFGVLTVATTSGTFIPGTTLLGAAGITATYAGSIDPSLNPILANETGKIAGINF